MADLPDAETGSRGAFVAGCMSAKTLSLVNASSVRKSGCQGAMVAKPHLPGWLGPRTCPAAARIFVPDISQTIYGQAPSLRPA